MVNSAEPGRARSPVAARSRSLPASGMRKGESRSTHHFTLIVDGRDLQGDGVIEALYEAGCDDALIGRSDGIQYAEFDREASGLVEAVLSAVADIERVEGVEVVRIADAGLVSMADIAARTGRTREGVRLLVTGARGPGGFPPPITDPRSRYRLWRWSEVERWLAASLEEETTAVEDHALAAINAGLELRHHGHWLDAGRRASLRALAGLTGGEEPGASGGAG